MTLIPIDSERGPNSSEVLPRLSLEEFEIQIAALLRAIGGDTSGLVYDDASGEWIGYEGSFHRWEDALLFIALRAIAEGAENPAQWAALAIQPAMIEYGRWYE